MDFEETYKKLNSSQRQAVETIDGPVLVVAGPGTGKTQLLSARVAHILRETDTLPQNILCLTFTESGAANMRDRLSQFIGKNAYDVTISTYHAFGSDIISRYREYFIDEDLSRPIDTLQKHQIVRNIVEKLSYTDRLKQARHHIRDLIATISEMKRALLTPDMIRALADENDAFLSSMESELADIYDDFTSMPRSLEKALPYFTDTLEAIKTFEPTTPVSMTLGSLARAARISLEFAMLDAETTGKTTPLTAWKNKWLEKNSSNSFVIAARLQNQRLRSLSGVFESYETALRAEGLFDFDDMILRAIDVIKANKDLQFTLQEQYQYILLDEYQDTNAAQAELVWLLTDNPVNEGRPNVMAVGDDDQAIYAFQGAQHSNMLEFFKHYRETLLINLSENYRSHSDILEVAKNIAEQINERLFHQFPGNDKELVASNNSITTALIERRDFQSDIAEYTWVSERIAGLIEKGADPKEIAILTPKHRHLEAIMPYLADKRLPVRYEKRENILESPAIVELITMSRLVLALGRDNALADHLWPIVLSYDFLQIPISTIWEISWRVADSNQSGAVEKTTWTRELMRHDNEQLRSIATLFAAISTRVDSEPCERVLDYLIGNNPVKTHELTDPQMVPFKRHYLDQSEATLVAFISDLCVLQAKLRGYQRSADNQLYLRDLVMLVDAYTAAEEPMLNTSPYAEADSAVQLMTVYKAKGLEFSHVFLLGMSDELWGASGRSSSNTLTLPANLAPTRHSGTTEDERLRLLFVAITRAKNYLMMTRHSATFSGKPTRRLKYLDERETADAHHAAHTLPEHFRGVITEDQESPTLEAIETSWRDRYTAAPDASLKQLLAPRLQRYQLSPTHLNTFCDLIYGGPQEFFINTILKFPKAPGIDGEFGSTIHETLQWIQFQVTRTSILPKLAAIIEHFSEHLATRTLPEDEIERLTERGAAALTAWITQRGVIFKPTDRAEVNFRREGVFVGDAHMAGTIDRLEINKAAKTITVVDFKTGRPHNRWSSSDPKLHKYRQQLDCYKILIEGSHTFAGYTVTGGRLEFVEPDEEGVCHTIDITFTNEEIERTRRLVASMWRHVINLDFPDTSGYEQTMQGIRKFEMTMLDEHHD